MASIEQLEQRLAALEHEVGRRRRHVRLALTALAGLATVMVAAAAAPDQPVPDVIQTRQLEIVDEQGRLVLRASASALGGQLDLWTSESRNVLRLSANTFGGDVALWNTEGVNVVGAFATEQGGETTLWNDQGARMVRNFTTAEGGRLDLHNRRDQPICSSWVTDTGGHVGVSNPAGLAVVAAQATERGGSLTVNNASGAPVVVSESDNAGTGAVRIADAEGQPLITARVAERGGVCEVENRDGLTVAVLGVADDRPAGALRLLNGEGRRAVNLDTRGDGSGRLVLANDAGLDVFSAESVKDSGAALTLHSASGQRTFLLAAKAKGGTMNIFNPFGTPIFAAGPGRNELTGAVSVMNERGIQVVQLSSDDDQQGLIQVWGPDGRRELGTLPKKRSVLDE